VNAGTWSAPQLDWVEAGLQKSKWWRPWSWLQGLRPFSAFSVRAVETVSRVAHGTRLAYRRRILHASR